MNKSLAIAGIVIKELYRRKDFYVLLVLTALITGLLGMINFFNESVVRYLKEICLGLIWVSSLVICITTAARQIPTERENRTIFPLLAKPVTRWEVVFGKFLGCWAACAIALVVFYVFFALVAESRGRAAPAGVESSLVQPAASSAKETDGHDGAPAHDHSAPGHVHDEHCEHAVAGEHSPIVSYFQALWLHWWMLGVVTALVLLGSVVLSAPSSNITISFLGVLGILLLGEHLHKVALRQTEPTQTLLSIIYFAIPHLEWFDLRDRVIYDHAPVNWLAMGLATLYAATFAGLFLFAAWAIFRRKGLNT